MCCFQYLKCKEQLRLSRYRENEEGTVSLPKTRSVATSSTFAQTDPIADKGFGVSAVLNLIGFEFTNYFFNAVPLASRPVFG